MLTTACVIHLWNLSLIAAWLLLSQFFWWHESGIHQFLRGSLPDYFYEYKATKKTIKLKFRMPSLLCVVR
jgi:hypothetical protein